MAVSAAVAQNPKTKSFRKEKRLENEVPANGPKRAPGDRQKLPGKALGAASQEPSRAPRERLRRRQERSKRTPGG